VFDSVIVVTDRLVLDKQLQDTIYQFEHRQGVVQKIDEDSRQLAKALASGVPVVITTLQKFPFVSRPVIEDSGRARPASTWEVGKRARMPSHRRGAQFAIR